jgi:hypothetical protein
MLGVEVQQVNERREEGTGGPRRHLVPNYELWHFDCETTAVRDRREPNPNRSRRNPQVRRFAIAFAVKASWKATIRYRVSNYRGNCVWHPRYCAC